MIAAVFLFFIIAGLFIVNIQFRNLKKQAGVLAENQAILLAQFLADSPEFKCNVGLGSYCIDTDKLIFLMNRPAYKNYWPVAYIKVVRIYPESTSEVFCTKENYPDCNTYGVYTSNVKDTTSTGSYVALCRKEKIEDVENVCELGKIIIGYEAR
jgi:hypothetical protein